MITHKIPATTTGMVPPGPKGSVGATRSGRRLGTDPSFRSCLVRVLGGFRRNILVWGAHSFAKEVLLHLLDDCLLVLGASGIQTVFV